MEKHKTHFSTCICNGVQAIHGVSTGITVENDIASTVPCVNHLQEYLSSGWTVRLNWKEEIYKALITVAKREPSFTKDDVFEEFEKTKVYINPDRRSYGNVVQRALKEGIMEWTGSSIVSRRKNCHSMLIRVYKSNIYEYTPVSWFKLGWDKLKLYWSNS
jgi:hypothetical protein